MSAQSSGATKGDLQPELATQLALFYIHLGNVCSELWYTMYCVCLFEHCEPGHVAVDGLDQTGLSDSRR